MSHGNMELARQLNPEEPVDLVAVFADRAEAWRGVYEQLVSPDFELVSAPGQIPLSAADSENSSQPTFYGFEGFVTAFREWLSAWESWVSRATGFVEVDERRVLVFVDVRARSKTHHVEMPIESANLSTFEDGRLVRMELFLDRSKALEAAGLRE